MQNYAFIYIIVQLVETENYWCVSQMCMHIQNTIVIVCSLWRHLTHSIPDYFIAHTPGGHNNYNEKGKSAIFAVLNFIHGYLKK